MSSTSEIATDYGNAIRDLKCNNKTQINMLTILAEDYKEVSPTIVDVLETEILESPPSRKILLLYVLDSIIKNIPESGQYRLHFAKNIAKIFTHVFEESGEKTRALLYKLRQTWADIFPSGKLYDIDMRVHAIDKAWPFTPIAGVPTTSAAAATTIQHSTVHVNPKFFKKGSTKRKASPATIGRDEDDVKPGKEELAKVRKEELKVVTRPPLNDEKPKIVNDSWRTSRNTSTPSNNAQSTSGGSPLVAINNQQPTSSSTQPTVLGDHRPMPNGHQLTVSSSHHPAMSSNDHPVNKSHNQSTISNETPRLPRLPTNNRVFVDGKAYEVIFLCDVPVIIRNGLPHRVSFNGPPRDIMIDGVLHKLAFGEVKTVIIDNEPHLIRFGAPSREFYMRDKAFRGVFGGPPIIVSIDGRRHEIRLLGPPPEAKIEQDPSYELTRYMTSAVPVSQQQQQPVFNHMTSMPPPMMTNGGSGAGIMAPPHFRPPPPIPNPATQSQNNFNEVNTLLKKLRYSGILGAITNQKKPNDAVPQSLQTQSVADIRSSNSPPIPSTQRLDNIERRAAPMSALDHFSMRSLAVRYDSVISALLKDRVECPSCGIAIKELYGEAYHQHTAWHMRVLKGDAYTRSRPWFMCNEWFTYSETDLTNCVIAADPEKVTEDKTIGIAGSTTGDALSSDVETNECCVCNEKFEEYFDEDDDAWKLRDCVLTDGKACHRYCKTDATLGPE